MAAPSKAQSFALAAEEIGGWQVRRTKAGEHKTVTATRGEESFEFTWTENRFHAGRHAIGTAAETYTNVKAALRTMAEPAGTVTVVEPTKRVGVRNPEKLVVRRLPFSVDSTDDEILAAVAGRLVTWTNSISGEEDSAIAPKPGGLLFKIEKLRSGKRVLHFVDQRYLKKQDAECRGFTSIDISKIVGVS